MSSSTCNGQGESPALAPSGVPQAAAADARRWPPGLANEIKFRILHFTPSWFSVNMGTGISSILIHNFPYSFRGQNTISLVIFGWNVLLFLIFFSASCIRYTVWPSIFRLMLDHNVQSLFLGTLAMGFATIVSMLAVISPHTVQLAWYLWMVDVGASILIAVGVPFLMSTSHQHEMTTTTGLWLLPIVSLIVAAATGGNVAEHLDPVRARLTVQCCYVLLGAGLLPALMVQALYFQRLALHKLPPAALTVSVLLPLGPCGQSAFALVQLARVGAKVQAATGAGVVPGGEMMTAAISAASVLAAFLLWGLGLWWLALALLTIGRAMKRGGFTFNMGWWGFTFPLGTVASAAGVLGKELDSGPWRIVGAIMSAAVVALTAFVTVHTVIGSIRGTVFSAPCLGKEGLPPKRSSSSEPPTMRSSPEATVAEKEV